MFIIFFTLLVNSSVASQKIAHCIITDCILDSIMLQDVLLEIIIGNVQLVFAFGHFA